jgi:hypothetical protein
MGVLRVKVGTNWVDVGGTIDPIWVDPSAPTDPNIEMWYDTDASSYAPSTSGTEASMPTAGPLLAGMYYFATDTSRAWLCDGVGWIVMAEPDQPFNVGMANVSLGGGGSTSSAYHRSDGYCDVSMNISLGSSTAGSIGTGPTFTLPKAANTAEVLRVIGSFTFYDATGPVFSLDPLLITATVMEPRYRAVSGSMASALGQMSVSVPAAIGVNDAFFARLRYKMATRYL